MTLETVGVGDPVPASLNNQLINHVNKSPGRKIIKVNDTWSVPDGVHSFKVYVAGGGGQGGAAVPPEFFDGSYGPGGPGGVGPLVSKVFTGQDIGTTFAITIGQGGDNGSSGLGGTTSFGTLLESEGGGRGFYTGSYYPYATPHAGVTGDHNGQIRHNQDMFMTNSGIAYGGGGVPASAGGGGYGGAGTDGICVIEW